MKAALAMLRNEAAQQAERAFLWLIVAFAAGIVLFFAWKADPAPWVGVAFITFGASFFTFRRRIPGGKIIGFALMAAGLGHAAAELRTISAATPYLARDTRPVMITGLVTDTEPRPGVNRIVVAPESIPGVAAAETPKRLRINIPRGHGLPRVGDAIQVRAVVGPAGAPVIPGGFQFQRYLYFAGIGGTGYAVGKWEAVSAQSQLTWAAVFLSTFEAWRAAIGKRVAEVVPGEAGALATALINGEQNAIPEDLQEAYRASGIAHLLSISGVHMTLLAGIVFFLVRRMLALFPAVALRMDTKKAAAWAGLAATGFYLVISGMSLPAMRAFVMIAVVLVAILLDRAALSLRTIGFAALLLMALAPDAIVGASFQMSFLAVLALVALYEQAWLKVRWRDDAGQMMVLRAAGIYIIALAVTDIVAGGATSLFAAYHFNRLPTYSVVANFAAVPITGLWVMPAGILGLLLMPVGLDAIPLTVMGAGVQVLNALAREVASWPGAQVHVPPMEIWAMALGALGVVFVCIWKGRMRWLGFAAVLPALIQPYVTRAPDVLVDDTARVFAVSDAEGHLAFRPGRTGRFVREVWTERYGLSPVAWPAPGASNAELGLSCDGQGCILARGGRTLLLAFTASALAEDCRNVDAVVSAVASYDLCGGRRGIDVIDLSRAGTHAVYVTKDGVRYRSVLAAAGARVWTRGVAGTEDAGED